MRKSTFNGKISPLRSCLATVEMTPLQKLWTLWFAKRVKTRSDINKIFLPIEKASLHALRQIALKSFAS